MGIGGVRHTRVHWGNQGLQLGSKLWVSCLHALKGVTRGKGGLLTQRGHGHRVTRDQGIGIEQGQGLKHLRGGDMSLTENPGGGK